MKINYLKFGTGDRVMLILPGLSIKPICEAPEALIEAYKIFADDFTVYLFDQRSDLPESYSIDEMAEDVYAKIEELDHKDIFLYGVSLGGMIALSLTAKYPKLIRKLALCSSMYKGNRIFEEWHGYAVEKSSYKLVDSFMDNVYSEEFNEKFKEATLVAFKDISDDEFGRFATLDDALVRCDISDELDEIKDKDILMLGSKKDRVFRYEDMKEMAERLAAEYYFYDGYSHAVYDEAPDIKERIRGFFLK